VGRGRVAEGAHWNILRSEVTRACNIIHLYIYSWTKHKPYITKWVNGLYICVIIIIKHTIRAHRTREKDKIYEICLALRGTLLAANSAATVVGI